MSGGGFDFSSIHQSDKITSFEQEDAMISGENIKVNL